MKTLDLIQGSPEWIAYRATARNASDAAAVLGCSPYMTRNELLAAMKTGIRAEVLPDQQRRFDDGHAIEAAQRAGAEEIIGEDLYPCVGSEVLGDNPLATDDGIELSASFDGLTLDESTGYECKTINDELRAALSAVGGMDANDANNLPKFYRVQMQQQCMVSGAKSVLFVAATADGSDVRRCWFYPDADLAREIMAGWRQFDADLATYVPQAPVEKITPAPIESLPAISARIEGSLAVHSNLDAFGQALRAFIARIPEKPTSDQEFADCDAACKALKKAEEALDGAEANALGQVQTVETLTRTIADLRNVARTARLASEKLVKARKDQIRIEECQRGRRAVDEHVQNLNQQIGAAYMPAIAADFGAAISGKKTLDSLRATVDQLIADKKIEANEVAGRITMNLRTVKSHGDYEFLFADLKSIVTKQPEDFQALVQSRVLAHQAEEKRRAEAAAERERDRIRQEEADKLRKEENDAAAAAASALAASRKQEVFTPELQTALEGVTAELTADLTIGRAANSSRVVPLSARGKPTLRLGEINDRIAPLAITEAGLAKLGFPAAARERSACMYHECDLPAMLDSTIAHLRMVQQRATEAEAA